MGSLVNASPSVTGENRGWSIRAETEHARTSQTPSRRVDEEAWDCTDRAAAERQHRGDQGINAREAMRVAREWNVSPYFHVEALGEVVRQRGNQSYFWARNKKHTGHWEPIKK